MFKIVKSSTLTALREQAARLPGLRQQLATAQGEAGAAQQAAEAERTDADTARADAGKARAELQALLDDRVIGLAALRDAVLDPERGPSVRGRIAVRIVRDWIASAKTEAAAAGGGIDPGLRLLGMLFDDETDDGTLPVPDGADHAATAAATGKN